jgi:hypothetical protein
MARRAFHGVRRSLGSLKTLTECAFVLSDALRVYDMEFVTLTKQGAYYKYVRLLNFQVVG